MTPRGCEPGRPPRSALSGKLLDWVEASRRIFIGPMCLCPNPVWAALGVLS